MLLLSIVMFKHSGNFPCMFRLLYTKLIIEEVWVHVPEKLCIADFGCNNNPPSINILQDPWWNPAVEEQAIMRIHRIGQTKMVRVKRFITKVYYVLLGHKVMN